MLMNKDPLTKRRILMFVDDVYEDLELWYPWLRLEEAGADVVVAGPEIRTYSGKHGYPATANARLETVEEGSFDGLVIPGGFAPDKLRRDPRVLEITRNIHEAGKFVAYICHAGWIPISARIVEGKTVTSTPGIKDDLENAGARWVDRPVVVDGNHITARRPPDLPEFLKEILAFLQ